ncbi:uncharacterized protein LOC104424818 [Eucalyptus grandis]|uniref:uncharacterized protein LOC104424818 n=1 Tax=Eucalyptus grandis TaxID=71139 RepID=UPI00192E7C89|nr:uncharacterized protein LOC104424818 [Eucalyptus grandis]
MKFFSDLRSCYRPGAGAGDDPASTLQEEDARAPLSRRRRFGRAEAQVARREVQGRSERALASGAVGHLGGQRRRRRGPGGGSDEEQRARGERRQEAAALEGRIGGEESSEFRRQRRLPAEPVIDVRASVLANAFYDLRRRRCLHHIYLLSFPFSLWGNCSPRICKLEW